MKLGKNWGTIVVVAAAVAVVVMCGYLLASWPPEPPTSNAQPAAISSQAPTDTAVESQPRLVVVGDSFSAESSTNAGPEWPALLATKLGWDVTTRALAGTGYVVGADGDAPIPERLPTDLVRDADVVIVAGGVEDLVAEPVPDIVAAAQQTVDALRQRAPADTQLVLVSPFSNGEPGPLTVELNDELRAIAQDADIPYIDATRWLTDSEKFFGDDPSHPIDAGQQRIATKMEQALVDLGLAEPADTAASAG